VKKKEDLATRKHHLQTAVTSFGKQHTLKIFTLLYTIIKLQLPFQKQIENFNICIPKALDFVSPFSQGFSPLIFLFLTLYTKLLM
jgi:hypothetical protein